MQLSLYSSIQAMIIQSSSHQMTTHFPPSNPSNIPPLIHLTDYQQLSPYSWSISTNSTSDDAEEPHPTIPDERKQRRMISNRESARRSRMRKQRHLDELWSQVLRLRTQNHCLIDKLNQISESHDRVLRENVSLKEEVDRLQTKLTHLQLDNSLAIFTDLEELSCNTAHLKPESSNQSVENFLH